MSKKIESYAPGSFCWSELATSDVESAKKFYGEMFGWTVVEFPMPDGVYVIFQSEGNDAAAARPASPGMPPHWGVYFSTGDADESAGRVAPLGGQVVAGPFDVMEAGRMATVQDPAGVFFSLWQPGRHIGATHGGLFNRVCWAELTSPDPAGAVAFYTGLFGWKTKPETGIDAADYVEWLNNGMPFGGIMPMRGEMWKGVPPHWMVYISVADCDERAARARQLGAAICVPPTDIPNVGRFSVITDVQGAAVSLIALTHMQAPAAA
jgi:predicted enzyme related to lactoylglutathione lyase